jgi:type VI secretion system secreted protein VgrG
MASGSHLQLTAADNLIATAGGNADIGAMNNLTLAAGRSASVFAQQDLKLVAGTKDFMAQAQTGQMRLTASQDLKVTSVNGHLVAAGGKSLMLSCEGAYIKLEGGNIELGCPGDITLKCDGHPWEGPASVTPKMPALSRGSVNFTPLADDGHSS